MDGSLGGNNYTDVFFCFLFLNVRAFLSTGGGLEIELL